MDPFRFTRQTIAFLGVLAAVELAIFLLFPTAIVVLAALAALLGLFVWLKTGMRSGRWLWWNPAAVPLTHIEGALALSAALMFSCGILVAGYEGIRFASGERELLLGYVWRYLRPAEVSGPPLPSRSHGTSYSDPALQQELKDELGKAGIPYTVKMSDGKEFVGWTSEHNAAVEEIQKKVTGVPGAGEHSVSFGDPATGREFREWLLKRGIPSETETLRGRESVVWKAKEGAEDLPMQFMNERSVPCKRDKAASVPAKAEVKRC